MTRHASSLSFIHFRGYLYYGGILQNCLCSNCLINNQVPLAAAYDPQILHVLYISTVSPSHGHVHTSQMNSSPSLDPMASKEDSCFTEKLEVDHTTENGEFKDDDDGQEEFVCHDFPRHGAQNLPTFAQIFTRVYQTILCAF